MLLTKSLRTVRETQISEIRQGAAQMLALCNPALIDNAENDQLRMIANSLNVAKRRVAHAITEFELAIPTCCPLEDEE